MALFLGARLALVIRAPTQLYHSEEYINLRLAASFLGEDGAWLPLTPPAFPVEVHGTIFDVPLLDAFQYQDFDGGTLAVSMMLVPLAWALGLSMASVKAGALLWTAAILLLWLEVLGHAGGRRGAAWGAAAFAFGPAPWLILSSIHWGNHSESAFGPPLILLAGLAAARSPGGGRVPAFAVLGAVAGFTVWFSQLNLLAGSLALVGALFIARARPWHLVPTAIGVCVGLAPRALRVGVDGVFSFGAQQVGLGQLVERLAGGGATWVELREMYWVHPSLISWRLDGIGSLQGLNGLEIWLRSVIAVATVAAVLFAISRRRDGRGLVLAACAVIVGTWVLQPALLTASSGLAPRRVANLYPLACVGVGLGCAALACWRKGAAIVLLAAWAVPNGYAQAVLLQRADTPDAPMNPWIFYAPPANEVWDRTLGGLPDLDADLVAAVYEALALVYAQPSVDATAASRGLFLSFAHGETALDRGRLDCAPPSGLPPDDALGAWGFGHGMRIRCRGGSPEPPWCDVVGPSNLEACLRGMRGEPPR